MGIYLKTSGPSFFDADFSQRMKGWVERGSRLLDRGAVCCVEGKESGRILNILKHLNTHSPRKHPHAPHQHTAHAQKAPTQFMGRYYYPLPVLYKDMGRFFLCVCCVLVKKKIIIIIIIIHRRSSSTQIAHARRRRTLCRRTVFCKAVFVLFGK